MTLTHAVQTSVSQCWDLENTRKINTEPYYYYYLFVHMVHQYMNIQ